jgi:hypothetical protein
MCGHVGGVGVMTMLGGPLPQAALAPRRIGYLISLSNTVIEKSKAKVQAHSTR